MPQQGYAGAVSQPASVPKNRGAWQAWFMGVGPGEPLGRGVEASSPLCPPKWRTQPLAGEGLGGQFATSPLPRGRGHPARRGASKDPNLNHAAWQAAPGAATPVTVVSCAHRRPTGSRARPLACRWVKVRAQARNSHPLAGMIGAVGGIRLRSEAYPPLSFFPVRGARRGGVTGPPAGASLPARMATERGAGARKQLLPRARAVNWRP
jgi:hypothetical protein